MINLLLPDPVITESIVDRGQTYGENSGSGVVPSSPDQEVMDGSILVLDLLSGGIDRLLIHHGMILLEKYRPVN